MKEELLFLQPLFQYRAFHFCLVAKNNNIINSNSPLADALPNFLEGTTNRKETIQHAA